MDCQRGCALAHASKDSTADTASCTNECVSIKQDNTT